MGNKGALPLEIEGDAPVNLKPLNVLLIDNTNVFTSTPVDDLRNQMVMGIVLENPSCILSKGSVYRPRGV